MIYNLLSACENVDVSYSGFASLSLKGEENTPSREIFVIRTIWHDSTVFTSGFIIRKTNIYFSSFQYRSELFFDMRTNEQEITQNGSDTSETL